jgi:hypothetical protein
VASQLKQLATSGAPPDRLQLQALTLQLHQQLPHLSTHQLSRAASTFARLNWKPSVTLRALCGEALARLGAFGTLDLVWLLWALGKLQYSTSLSKRLAKDSLGLLLERQEGQERQEQGGGQQGGLSSIDAASLLWACGRLGYRNDLLLEPLLELLLEQHSPYQRRQAQAQGQGQAPDARTAANVVWACARLGLQHKQLQDWAESAELGGATPQAVSNIVWGLWKLGGLPAPRLPAPRCHACGRRQQPPAAALRAPLAAASAAAQRALPPSAPLAAGRRPSPALVSTATAHLQACASRWARSCRRRGCCRCCHRLPSPGRPFSGAAAAAALVPWRASAACSQRPAASALQPAPYRPACALAGCWL